MKVKNKLQPVNMLAGMACAILFCSGSALAQMDPGSGSRPRQPASATDNNSRSRRTDSAAEEKPSTSADGASSSKTPRQSNTSPNATQETTDTKPKATAASPIDLRTQIDTTTNPQEKYVLRMKLVDQLIAANKKAEAINELHEMANEDRFDPQGFYNLGNAMAKMGDSEGAVAAYRKAIEQRNGGYSRALNNLGVVLMRLGNWQEANDALTKALRLENFHYAEASYNLGRLYATQGQMDLAIREWQRAVRVDPQHHAAANALERARRNDDQIVVATPTSSNESKSKRSSTPTTGAGASSPTNANTSVRTMRGSSRVLSVDPITYNQLQRARSAHERGKDDEAIASYRNVISRMGGYFGPANLELSYILIGMKQPGDALNYLRDVTARDGSRYPISYYHLARIYEFNGELDLANEAYKQAASYFHGINSQFLLDVSRVCEKRGDYKGALAAMEEYLTSVERQGTKPQWSDERLASLRQKVSKIQPKQ